MRRKKGMMGVIGIFALAFIFLFGAIFSQQIFYSISNASASNTAGTVYDAPYHGVENVTFTFSMAGIPIAYILIIIIGIIVALGALMTI